MSAPGGQVIRTHEDHLVETLLTVAARFGNEQRASLVPSEIRGDQLDEAERLAQDHGFYGDRLIAMGSLARSRGVDLAVVLRAALRGDLRGIVALPDVRGE